jgi:hypothetical protein
MASEVNSLQRTPSRLAGFSQLGVALTVRFG